MEDIIGESPSQLPEADSIKWGEIIEEGDVGGITFSVEIPDITRLKFNCRDRSVGVLSDNEVEECGGDDYDDGGAVDPFFFDSGYTLAGRTGFQIWSASRILIEYLASPTPLSLQQEKMPKGLEALCNWRHRIANDNLNVIELGSGVGLVGACLAARGANVMLTDLPTLVENATEPNLSKNQHIEAESKSQRPGWFQDYNAKPLGKGWAATAPLDWTQPMEEQLPVDLCENIDVVVSSDCVWLVSMLDALLDTVASIFRSSSKKNRGHYPTFLMSFRRRDPKTAASKDDDESSIFTTAESVIAEMKARQWTVKCLSWQWCHNETPKKEVFLFEIRPK